MQEPSWVCTVIPKGCIALNSPERRWGHGWGMHEPCDCGRHPKRSPQCSCSWDGGMEGGAPLSKPGPEGWCPPGDTGNYAPDRAREQEESTDRGGPSAGSKEPLPLSGQAEVTLVPLSLVPPLEGSHISHPRSEEPHPRKLPGPGSPGNCFLGAEPTVCSGAS